MGQAHYLLDVQRVYKGDVQERARVDSDASGAACGLEGITAGRRYAFFLQGDGSPWTANLCGGTGFAVDRDHLERAIGVADAGAPVGVAPAPAALSGSRVRLLLRRHGPRRSGRAGSRVRRVATPARLRPGVR